MPFCINELDLCCTVACDAAYLRMMLDIAPKADPHTTTGTKTAADVGFEKLPVEAFLCRKRKWPDEWSKKEQRAPWEWREDAP
jgi:hypothetical protein